MAYTNLIITILTDNPDSWRKPYVDQLIDKLRAQNHIVNFVYQYTDILVGDIAFFLSCEHIVPRNILIRNKHNLVVHESDLPKGKGWSPLTWQILEGHNVIPIVLFEAIERVDSGSIYFQDEIHFEGHELIDEIHKIQGTKTIELCLKFIKHYPNSRGIQQQGKESFYKQRTIEAGEVNVNKTIAELFNNFRVADNNRYPIFFKYKEHKYILKIEKED